MGGAGRRLAFDTFGAAVVTWLGTGSRRAPSIAALALAAVMSSLAFGLVGVGRNPALFLAGGLRSLPVSGVNVHAELRGSDDAA